MTGDMDKNWQRFKQKLELYFTVTKPHDKPLSKEAKTAILLSLAGEDVLEVFNNFSFSEAESKEDYEAVVCKLDAYWAAQTNEVYARYLFRKRMQATGESFEQFSRDVRMQARSCNFGQLTDSMIRDQIVIGISNEGLRAKLL